MDPHCHQGIHKPLVIPGLAEKFFLENDHFVGKFSMISEWIIEFFTINYFFNRFKLFHDF
jgi:hypothetical protein